MSAWRPALTVLGLFSLAGCGFDRLLGPLEISVEPVSLTGGSMPRKWSVTHVAVFSSYSKLIDECGPGTENVEKMYERRFASRNVERGGEIWADFYSSVIRKAAVRCLEKRPGLIPKECRHRMVAMSGMRNQHLETVVTLQCGMSAILPLEVTIQPLDPAGKTKSSPAWGTYLATYSNLDKLLAECGLGFDRTWHLAIETDKYQTGWNPPVAFGRMIDDALVKCLKKRNLIPAECRHEMVSAHNGPWRSFEPKVHFRCGSGPDSQLQ